MCSQRILFPLPLSMALPTPVIDIGLQVDAVDVSSASGHVVVAASHLTGRYWSGRVVVFAWSEPHTLHSFSTHSGQTDAKWAGNSASEVIVTGSDDGNIYVWKVPDASTSEEATPTLAIPSLFWGEHDDSVMAVDVQGESTVASGSSDHTYLLRIVYENSRPCSQATFPGHTGPVWTVAWQPKSQTLASGSQDRTVRIWDSRESQCSQILRLGDPVFHVCFNKVKPTEMAISKEGTGVLVMDLRQPDTPLHTITSHKAVVHCQDFDTTGTMLATASDDTSVHVFHLDQDTTVHRLTHHTDFARAVKWIPQDPTALVTGSWDKSIRVERLPA